MGRRVKSQSSRWAGTEEGLEGQEQTTQSIQHGFLPTVPEVLVSHVQGWSSRRAYQICCVQTTCPSSGWERQNQVSPRPSMVGRRHLGLYPAMTAYMGRRQFPETGPEGPVSQDFQSVHFPAVLRIQVWVSEDPSIIQALSRPHYMTSDKSQPLFFSFLFCKMKGVDGMSTEVCSSPGIT